MIKYLYLYCKYFKCKHILATFYRLDKYTFPVEARQIEMGCNRKRGHPRKTKPTLKYQEEV